MAIDFIVPADIEAWEEAWRERKTSFIGQVDHTPIRAVRHLLEMDAALLAYGPDMLGRVLLHWEGRRVLVRHSWRDDMHVCEYLKLGPIGSRPAHPPSGDGYRPLPCCSAPALCAVPKSLASWGSHVASVWSTTLTFGLCLPTSNTRPRSRRLWRS